ncbi:MAG: hypothetical protein U9N12_01940 [Euryarchaeota archaeon]|nr:hypothetical protein [Euryarchaeota archaeon]
MKWFCEHHREPCGAAKNREIATKPLVTGDGTGCIPIPVQLPGYVDPVAVWDDAAEIR